MSHNIGTPPLQSSSGSVRSRLIRASLISIFISTAANLGLYYAVGILFPQVTTWPGSGPAQIVAATIVYLLIGTVVFAVVLRLSSHPARSYRMLATIGLVLSLGLPVSAGFGYGPPGAPTAGVATVITLCLMHIVSYAISVPLFIRITLD